jgi:hypothetical protein
MKDQTVMGLLVELPTWLQAANWVTCLESGLLILPLVGLHHASTYSTSL